MVSPTPNKGLTYPANGGDIGTWDTPVNADWNAIDTALGGLTTLNVTSVSGTVALNLAQYTPPIIEITGTLTAAINYQFPSGVGGFWFVSNFTTGAFAIEFSSATGGGTTVVVEQGITTPIFCDQTNVALQSTLALAAGATGEVQFNQNGLLAGNTSFQTDGTNVTVGGSVTTGGEVTVGTDLIVSGAVAAPLNIEANAQTPSETVAFSATAMAVNCELSNVFATVLTANVTTAPALTNLNDGQTINWFLTQDATGSRTMTWPVSFKWPGGTAGVLSTTANAVDLLVATYRVATGNWYASLLKNFS